MDIRNDLIPLHAQPLAAVFADPDAMNKVLAQIQRVALAETADPATEDGRASIKSLAYKVSRSKTALDDVGKPLADAARLDYDKINAIRKTAKEFLDALRDDIRKPVNAWEAVEGARVKAHEDKLHLFNSHMLSTAGLGSDILRADIERIRQVSVGVEWQEFQDAAVEAKAKAMAHLETILAEAEKTAAAAAELEALRAEKLEREAVELERAREAAIAERERVAAENARKQAKIDAEAALEREKERGQREFDRQQRELAEANLRAERAATAERESIEAEREADDVERREREANDAHRHDRQETILKALTRAPVKLSEGDATRVVGAVADKLIPFLRIEY